MITRNPDNQYYMDEGFRVLIQRNVKDVEKHTHNFVEFAYVFSGKCVHYVDGIEYPAQKGDLLFINSGSEHTIKSNDCVTYADILLKPEYISDSLTNNENVFSLLNLDGFEEFSDIINIENCLVNFSGDERRMIEMFINLLVDEEEVIKPAVNIMLKSGINMLLTLIFRKMSLPMKYSFGMDYNLLIYIKENSVSGITLPDIAQKCGYSTAHFSRLFKEFSGINFSDYVTNCKIEEACKLLKGSDMPVEEIIFNCGFTNRTRFFKVFTEKMGMTPKKYRANQRQIL